MDTVPRYVVAVKGDLVLTGGNLHPANLPVERVVGELHHAGELQTQPEKDMCRGTLHREVVQGLYICSRYCFLEVDRQKKSSFLRLLPVAFLRSEF